MIFLDGTVTSRVRRLNHTVVKTPNLTSVYTKMLLGNLLQRYALKRETYPWQN